MALTLIKSQAILYDTALSLKIILLPYFDKFYFQYQVRIRRNNVFNASAAVAQCSRDHKPSFAAGFHPGHPEVPGLHHPVRADLKLDRLTLVVRVEKLRHPFGRY